MEKRREVGKAGLCGEFVKAGLRLRHDTSPNAFKSQSESSESWEPPTLMDFRCVGCRPPLEKPSWLLDTTQEQDRVVFRVANEKQERTIGLE